MNKLLILILFVFNFSAFAFDDFKGCGEYSFHGRLIKNDKNELAYLVYEGTRSQLTFSIDEADVSTIAAYLNKPTSFVAIIPKPMNGTHGSIKKISKITPRLPNPLVPEKDSYIKLISKKDCEK